VPKDRAPRLLDHSGRSRARHVLHCTWNRRGRPEFLAHPALGGGWRGAADAMGCGPVARGAAARSGGGELRAIPFTCSVIALGRQGWTCTPTLGLIDHMMLDPLYGADAAAARATASSSGSPNCLCTSSRVRGQATAALTRWSMGSDVERRIIGGVYSTGTPGAHRRPGGRERHPARTLNSLRTPRRRLSGRISGDPASALADDKEGTGESVHAPGPGSRGSC